MNEVGLCVVRLESLVELLREIKTSDQRIVNIKRIELQKFRAI